MTEIRMAITVGMFLQPLESGFLEATIHGVGSVVPADDMTTKSLVTDNWVTLS